MDQKRFGSFVTAPPSVRRDSIGLLFHHFQAGLPGEPATLCGELTLIKGPVLREHVCRPHRVKKKKLGRRKFPRTSKKMRISLTKGLNFGPDGISPF